MFLLTEGAISFQKKKFILNPLGFYSPPLGAYRKKLMGQYPAFEERESQAIARGLAPGMFIWTSFK